jgi:hypothetical protein
MAATPRQEALRLIEEAQGDVHDLSEPGELDMSIYSPVGAVWNATDCHTLVVCFYTDRPAGWKHLLTDLRLGTRPCDIEDCEICNA